MKLDDLTSSNNKKEALNDLQSRIDKLEHQKNAILSRLVEEQQHNIKLRDGERFIAHYGSHAMILMPGVMEIGEEGGLNRAHAWARDRGGYIPTQAEMQDIVNALIWHGGTEMPNYFARLYPGHEQMAYFLSHRKFNGIFNKDRVACFDGRVDNGIMVAWAGATRYSSCRFPIELICISAIAVRFEDVNSKCKN